MTLNKMEKIKLSFDLGIAIFGVLAALFAVLSLIYGSKIDTVKKIDEERLKSKIAESNASAEKAKEESANAMVNVASANERAKTLELKVEEQKEKTAEAENNLIVLNKTAKKLELRVEEQKEKTATAEKDLIILKEKIKPRSIPTKYVNILIDELKKLPKTQIGILSSLGDGEASIYATQFENIFKLAGWKVESGVGFSIYTGVGLYLFTESKADKEAIEIKKIFNALDIHFQEQINPSGGKLQIFIGSKDSQNLGIK